MREIYGRWALVTGAASGIGRAISLRLAHEGVHLFLIDIDDARLEEVVAEARQAGVEAIGHQADVAESCEVSAAVAEVVGRCGGVDILVNNAGVSYYGRTDRMAADHWDRLLRVNLLSHVQFTRELLPTLLARRQAHVLNVCSALGLVGMPKVSAYCTSKFAMVGFSEALRHEYGRVGLGVTALCPGFVRTNLFDNAVREENGQTQRLPPRLICTTPERVANAAVKAIRRNRRLVVVEPFARLLYATKRFAPWLIDLLFHVGRRKRIERKMAQLAAGTLSYGILSQPSASSPQQDCDAA